MKKYTAERREFYQAAATARWRNELRRKHKVYDPDKPLPIKKVLGQEFIVAPEYISIYEFDGRSAPYYKTMDFLDRIAKRYKVADCALDFSKTKKISAAALVVVYAAIEMAGLGRSGKASAILSKASRTVNEMLKGSNILKLINGHGISYALDSARSMPIISSVGTEQMEEIIDFIQNRIFEDQMSPDTEHVYGDAVSETINNVRLHAYPNTPAAEKRWWLMCSTFGRQLYLAIYDCGVGIPTTVVDQPWFFPLLKYTDPEAYEDLIAKVPGLGSKGIHIFSPKMITIPDERLIYYSMQNDVSGTKQEKHGQGSKSIKALVNDTDDGLLWVFSNKGLYTFSAEDQTPATVKLKKRFPGTLVQWNIEI